MKRECARRCFSNGRLTVSSSARVPFFDILTDPSVSPSCCPVCRAFDLGKSRLSFPLQLDLESEEGSWIIRLIADMTVSVTTASTMARAILFDMDGTLLGSQVTNFDRTPLRILSDSTPAVVATWEVYARQYSLDLRDVLKSASCHSIQGGLFLTISKPRMASGRSTTFADGVA